MFWWACVRILCVQITSILSRFALIKVACNFGACFKLIQITKWYQSKCKSNAGKRQASSVSDSRFILRIALMHLAWYFSPPICLHHLFYICQKEKYQFLNLICLKWRCLSNWMKSAVRFHSVPQHKCPRNLQIIFKHQRTKWKWNHQIVFFFKLTTMCEHSKLIESSTITQWSVCDMKASADYS